MSCRSPDGPTDATTRIKIEGRTTVHRVDAMTCGPCEDTPTKAIGEIDTVGTVSVGLSSGQVTVVTGDEPDDPLIAKVVNDAGHAVAGRVRRRATTPRARPPGRAVPPPLRRSSDGHDNP